MTHLHTIAAAAADPIPYSHVCSNVYPFTLTHAVNLSLNIRQTGYVKRGVGKIHACATTNPPILPTRSRKPSRVIVSSDSIISTVLAHHLSIIYIYIYFKHMYRYICIGTHDALKIGENGDGETNVTSSGM